MWGSKTVQKESICLSSGELMMLASSIGGMV